MSTNHAIKSTGCRAPPPKNTLIPCDGSRSHDAAPGALVPGPSSSRPSRLGGLAYAYVVLGLRDPLVQGLLHAAELRRIEITACQRDRCSASFSRMSCVPRARSPGKDLFVVLLMILRQTQELDPPANPTRFIRRLDHVAKNSRLLYRNCKLLWPEKRISEP
jgi:hypothetical protein